MTLETKLIALAQAIGTDIKSLNLTVGDIQSLTTTSKSNIVDALNEVHLAVNNSGAQIDDQSGQGNYSTTWSSNKIIEELNELHTSIISDLTGGAPEALDTLAELAEALNNNPSFAAEIATQIGNRVRFDTEQALSAAQKLQVCQNIGIGDIDVDLVSAYNDSAGN